MVYNARARRAERAQRHAAIRHLSDRLVTGRIVPINPAGSGRSLATL